MEGRNIKSLLMICLVLGLLVQQSTALSSACYARCVAKCLLSHGAIQCAAECLPKCILPTSLDNVSKTHYYCKLGCASSLCTKISTKENHAVEKVAGCVDSCSDICPKN